MIIFLIHKNHSKWNFKILYILDWIWVGGWVSQDTSPPARWTQVVYNCIQVACLANLFLMGLLEYGAGIETHHISPLSLSLLKSYASLCCLNLMLTVCDDIHLHAPCKVFVGLWVWGGQGKTKEMEVYM